MTSNIKPGNSGPEETSRKHNTDVWSPFELVSKHLLIWTLKLAVKLPNTDGSSRFLWQFSVGSSLQATPCHLIHCYYTNIYYRRFQYSNSDYNYVVWGSNFDPVTHSRNLIGGKTFMTFKLEFHAGDSFIISKQVVSRMLLSHSTSAGSVRWKLFTVLKFEDLNHMTVNSNSFALTD